MSAVAFQTGAFRSTWCCSPRQLYIVNYFHLSDEFFQVVNNRGPGIVSCVERHVAFVIFSFAWRPEMMPMTIHSMMTMQYVSQLDWKLIRYGASWIAAIAASMIGVVAYA